MKRLKIFSGLLALLFLVLAGCTPDQCNMTRTYTKYEPVFMTADEFRSSVAAISPRAMESPGKIFFKGDYLYINEFLKGVHVIDNSNPSSPTKVAFINIPGNTEIAVKGNILYADSYTDLVAVNIVSPGSATVTQRIEDLFPFKERLFGVNIDKSQGYVKEWISEEVVENYMGDCAGIDGPGRRARFDGLPVNNVDDGASFGGTAANDGGSNKGEGARVGLSGSMASLVIYEDYLYSIVEGVVKVIDISTVSAPVYVNDVSIGWGIETLFPYKDMMFVGSQNGMFIYDLANPMYPTELSRLEHTSSCDPVVVEDDIAYVTLRGGTPCDGYTNELILIDVSNPSSPSTIKRYDMTNPHGLGVDAKTVFVCDGDAGLKVYDANNSSNIKLLQQFKDINTYDVIPLTSSDVLMMIGNDGLYQYDYTNLDNVSLLSVIPVE